MNIREINIRDPYIMLHDDKYYMYGTRSETTWGLAEGFDCYVSEDLSEWDGPVEIFHRPEGFFSDRAFWAPECICYDEAFYLITTFGEASGRKGVFALKSLSPTGPFEMYSERLTPEDWVCIDGSIYFDDEEPVLLFSHSFEDSPTGDICMVRLSKDLKTAVSEPLKLFEAAEAKWARPVPFAKAEFGIDGDVYFTDGPGVIKMEDGRLYMTWSSWSVCAYAVGVAVSDSGKIEGPWRQLEEPIYPVNGGHGMVFRDKAGELHFTLHYPNDKYLERPVIYLLKCKDGTLILE